MRNSVLIIGGGGREHSLAVAMMNSPQVAKVYMDSRNAACEKFALPVPPYDNYDELATFCRQQNIALVIIGPEAPLAEGIADILRAAGVAVFGPSQKAAKIEYSKIYAKNLMRKHNIATPDFAECENFAQVAKWCAARRPPYVIKADSLAAGKGVFICDNAQMAQEAAAQILGGKFGGKRLLAEEYCGGDETSFIVISDGKNALPLPDSSDYKRLHDDGKGANTGGMGAVSPSKFWNAAAQETAMRQILKPVLAALAEDGAPFCGFLYAGLVRDINGKWLVLEFNCRMGDPEAQAILPRLRGDIFPLLLAAASGNQLHELQMPPVFGASVCVVLAAEGYPASPITGDEITIDIPLDGVCYYHAATKTAQNGKTITCGGRVMSVVAVADNAARAAQLAYCGADGVKFRAMHYRKDIGK